MGRIAAMPGSANESRSDLAAARTRPHRAWRSLVPLALAAVVPFLPVLGNGFVSWDDDANFLNNPDFRGLGWSQIRWAWTTDLLDVYQPLSWMLFELEYVLWKLGPLGYHLTSLVLHASAVVLLYLVTVALLGRVSTPNGRADPDATRLGAALAAALFAAHPMRVEVVAWASCQPYLPCAICYLLAVLADLRAHPGDGRDRPGWSFVALAMAASAMLFKAAAVTLPAVLLILDVYPYRRLGLGPGRLLGRRARRVWPERLPFLGLGLLFASFAMRARASWSEPSASGPGGLAPRAGQAAAAVGLYLAKTVVPSVMTIYRPVPRHPVFSDPPLLAMAILAVAAMAVVFVLGRRSPGLRASGAAYLTMLAPHLGLIGVASVLAADRYVYLASFALTVPIAEGLRRAARGPGRWPTLAAGIVLLAILSTVSWRQSRLWGSTERLYAQALERGGSDDPLLRNNFGAELLARGDLDGADRQFAECLRANPKHFGARNNLGLILARRGRLGEAAGEFSEAIRLEPRFAEAYKNRGEILVRLGRPDEAMADYEAALRLDPDFAAVHAELAPLLARRGRTAEAVRHYEQALRLEPSNALLYAALGTLLARTDRLAEAVSPLRRALRLRPDYHDARNNLGLALLRLGRVPEAEAEFARVLQARPDHPVARRGLAEVGRLRGPRTQDRP